MNDMVTVLELEMYSEAGAASLLDVPQPTLHYWLEGKSTTGKIYRPVIREKATGAKNVTWAEFVEAGLLRQYRRVHRIPMIELRNFIDDLRERLGIPYPLAHAIPFVSGRTLMLEAQQAAGLRAEFALVASVDGQLVLTPTAEQFYRRVTWSKDLPVRWRPSSTEKSTVVIDPEIRSGRPAVAGISTEAIWEQSEDGASIAELSGTFDLSERDVRWAVAYESEIAARSA